MSFNSEKPVRTRGGLSAVILAVHGLTLTARVSDLDGCERTVLLYADGKSPNGREHDLVNTPNGYRFVVRGGKCDGAEISCVEHPFLSLVEELTGSSNFTIDVSRSAI